MVSKYIKKTKKHEILGDNIENAVKAVMKNWKQLQQAAALFSLNPSNAF
jgi:hypothetical protein